MSLYHKYRPQDFKDVVGQNTALSILVPKVKDDDIPQVILITGPSGCGKSTIAYILARALGCRTDSMDTNLTKINCADDRGMDMVRGIDDTMRLSGLGIGRKKRVWILEETVQLPKATQQAFLDILENPPSHAYFIFCSSDTTGLIPTFLSRCFSIQLKALTTRQTEDVVARVLTEENRSTTLRVLQAISKAAEGSARVALQLLEAALTTTNEEGQLEAIGAASQKIEEKGEFLAKSLFAGARWEEVKKVIDKLEDKDVDGLRRAILNYAGVILLRVPNTQKCNLAYKMIRCFEDPYKSCPRTMLGASVWEFMKDNRV